MSDKAAVRDLVERVVMGLRTWPEIRKLVRAGVEGRIDGGALADQLVAAMPDAWRGVDADGTVGIVLSWTHVGPKLVELEVPYDRMAEVHERMVAILREDAKEAWTAAVEAPLRDLAGALRGAAEGDPVDLRAVEEALARIPISSSDAAAIVRATPRLDAAWASFTPPPPRPAPPPPPPGPDPVQRAAELLKNAVRMFSGIVGAGLAAGSNARPRWLEPLVVLPGPIARLHVDGDGVIVVLDDGEAVRVRLSAGTTTRTTPPPDARPPDALLDAMPDAEGPIVDAMTLPDGRIAAVGAERDGGFVVLGDPSTEAWDVREAWESALLSVAERDGRLLAGTADGEVVVFDGELEAIGGADVSRRDDRVATLDRRGETVKVPAHGIRAVAWVSDEQVVAGTQAGGLYLVELAWAD